MGLGSTERAPNYGSIVRDGYRLGKAEAEKLEADLAGNPADLTVRTKLLGFYFRGASKLYGPEAIVAARRRHILWLIEHHPGSTVAGLRQMTIDPTGHGLADKDGYDQAAKLWLAQVQRYGNDPAVLGNAGDFFLLPDKVQAEALYKRARRAAPHNPEWSKRLGYLYALGFLGLDMMNENGLPTSHNPAEAKGDFARHAREELEKSEDAEMVATAGLFLSTHGPMLDAMFRGTKLPLTVDYATLTEALLIKAQRLHVTHREALSRALDEFRRSRRKLEDAK